MKSEDRSSYPGRIDNQPYTMERTVVHINHSNEEEGKLGTDTADKSTSEKADYIIEDNDEYAGI